jgi:2Fe-2S ferredoxin
MPIIKILPHSEYCPEGKEIEAPAGTSICEALLEHDIDIEHACEMSCACTTCHVIVREGFDSLNELDERGRPARPRMGPGAAIALVARPSWRSAT